MKPGLSRDILIFSQKMFTFRFPTRYLLYTVSTHAISTKKIKWTNLQNKKKHLDKSSSRYLILNYLELYRYVNKGAEGSVGQY